jgi:hypothetical protein
MSKQRVESCFTIGPPQGPLRDTKGTWHWRINGWTANYSIHTNYPQLHLQFNHRGYMRQEIPLVHTKPNYGGIRWWFLCPKCSRRVSRLYKPSQAYCFFCRHCHDLTYESAQLSGTKMRKVVQATARKVDTTTREVRRWILLDSNPCFVHEVKRPVVNKVRDRRTGFALLVTQEARSKGLSI